jgi:hypothetical protein
LKERDSVKRFEHCRRFRDVITANEEDILGVTFFADEVWFYLSGYVNSQNSRVWSETIPHIKDTPIHAQEVIVWRAVSRCRIIGPIFFDDTINLERYCVAILYPLFGHLNVDETGRGHFQQDGAAAHTAHVSVTPLRGMFRDTIISKDMLPTR